MTPQEKPIQQLMDSLQERAKELNCLYRIDEALADPTTPLRDACRQVVEAIPAGWKYPEACAARIVLDGVSGETANFRETPWTLVTAVEADGENVGTLAVCYTQEKPPADEGPFLKEERKLLNAIAQRAGFFVRRVNLRQAHASLKSAQDHSQKNESAEWNVILDFLRRTDPDLLRRITRRMINYLELSGVSETERLLKKFTFEEQSAAARAGDNMPLRKAQLRDFDPFSKEAFEIAARNLGQEEMVTSIRSWIDEERSAFLVEALEDQSQTLSEVVQAIERHRSLIGETGHLPPAFRKSLSAAILRRLFSDDSSYIELARDFVNLDDIYELIEHIVYPLRGHGKLGGKSAGLFLAQQLLRSATTASGLLHDVRVPRTWYVSSNAQLEFLGYNNLRDLYFRKYMEIEHIRQEYPHIIHLLKNSSFPPDISRGLGRALDDLGDRPIIVRSSSLLEDRMGSSFAGKYKSLFLPNTGSRAERLDALQDAIAEVYASTFGPDPIEYRAERGLLNIHEEMGILIQEVVGQRVGKYFLPAFSGVGLSHNEFRWSARIGREDGLLRLVPGLGTRAVDRIGDDYPILIAPGQPGLRVNVTPDEIRRYAPRFVDLINLETGEFETLSLSDLLGEYGEDFEGIRQIVSIDEDGRIRKPMGFEPDFEKDELVVTFEGLIRDTRFIDHMKSILDTLRERLDSPVDIEFASDGKDIYLLQFRAQSHAEEFAPAPIPRNLPADMVLFYAHKNISNGRVPDISHIVYIDPDRYAELSELDDLRAVGKAVSRLNKLLPKRQFILIGPGRWGSRGDIKLGVNVTYGDINNTAVLIEVARSKGNYVPELSFGTHFFQDLVESDIRYIPLYPDEPDCVLDERLLRRAPNLLPSILPEREHLSAVVHVVEVGQVKENRVLRILMNAELDEAVGIFDLPHTESSMKYTPADMLQETPSEAHWRWRLRMAERIAADLDPERFGVKALYIFGSVKNASAGPGSDIDLLVHDEGEGPKRDRLALWLEAWSLSLAEINYLRTGSRSEGLLDVHYVTDEDIARRTSFAAKIDAVTDAARPLTLRREPAKDAG
ncbi:MAG: PEP/pyruvate-binding domain-containing protein [Xanthomonadales bacterium]